MSTRRDFIKASTLLGFGGTVPTFLGRTALAAEPLGKSDKDTILVVVQLTGGNDGLNTVVPYANEQYYKLRPTIAIPKNQVRKLNDSLGLHPAMDAMAKLHADDAALCVVQGVGYPNPSQSHFRSMDIWQAASTDETLTEGWLGKGLKQKPLATFHLAASANEVAPLALAGAPARAPSITSLEDFQLKTTAASGKDQAAQKSIITSAATSGRGGSAANPLLDFVSRTATNTYASSERLKQIGKGYTPKVPYPETGLGNRLKLAAQLIEAGVGARIFYVSLDGFDTHAGQGAATGAHANLLRQVSDAIAAFYKDLAGRGHGNRVCVMTFSEFGRRGGENGSKGTDHGSGAPMFLVGGKVKPGIVGDNPNLAKLEKGNLPFATDFRSVYAAVLEKWLGLDAKSVLGAEFKPAGVFKS